jgi:MFS family permease
VFVKRLDYRWLVVLAGTVTIFSCSLGVYSFGVFLRPLTLEFGWDRGALSLALSIAHVASGILGIVAGRLSDRYGPRLLVSFSGIMLGTGFLLMTQVSSLGQAYVFWGLCIGSAIGFAVVPVISTIPGWFVRRRGIAVAIAISGFGLGAITAPILAQLLISTCGWRTSFLVLGVIGWATVIPLAQFIRRSPSHTNPKPDMVYGDAKTRSIEDSDQVVSFTQTVRTLPFWVFGAIYFLWLACEQAIVVHIIPHATDSGITDLVAAGILSVMAGVSIVGRLSMGFLSDRLGSLRALSLCLLLATIALWWLLFIQGVSSFYIWAVLFGFTFGGMVPLQMLVPMDLFGTKSLGAILGVLVFMSTVGASCGPLLAGYTYDLTGRYYAAFVTLAAVCMIATLLGLILWRYKAKQMQRQ